MKNLYLSILCLLISSLTLSGQYDSLQGRWLHYGLESGLRTNSFRVVTQDALGFIWIGTDDGLYTFDGYIFREIENEFSISEGFNKITDLQYISQSNIVVISSQNGLYSFDCSSRELRKHDNIIVNSISIDYDNNRCYYAGRSKGVLSSVSKIGFIDLTTLDTATLSGWSSEIYISQIAFDQGKNQLWLGHDSLMTYNLKTQIVKNIKTPNSFGEISRINDIVVHSDYILVATRGSGILAFNAEKKLWEQYRYHPEINSQNRNVIQSILPRNDTVYVSTADLGPGFLDLNTKKFSFYIYDREDRFSISQITARSIFVDREENVWVAMANSLSLLAKEQNLFNLEQHYLDRNIDSRSISQYYLLATDSLILQANRGSGKLFTYDSKGIPISDPFTYENESYRGVSIIESSWGKIYSNSKDAIYEINPEKRTVRSVFDLQDIPDNIARGRNFYRILNIKDTLVIWQKSLLTFLTYKNGKISYSHSETINSIDEVQSIDNQIYVSNIESLMLRVSRNNYKTFKPISDSLYTGAFSPIHLSDYDNDHIILGTVQLGIAKMNKHTGHFTMIDRNSGLKTNVVTRLTTDSHGNIWALSSAGLLLYNKKHQATAVFTENEGMFSTDLIPYIIQNLGNDNIGISVDHGLNLWNIQSMGLDEEAPAIRIHTIDGLGAQKGLVFPPNTKQINLSYSNFDYGLTHAHRFEYSLNNQDWAAVERAGTVQLIASKAGKYKMRIRGIDGFGRRMKEAELSFKISPYWYQTYWFIVLSLLCAFGVGLYLMHRVNQRRKNLADLESNYKTIAKEMENQILRAQMNPHFLFNSLNSIRYFILTKETDKAANYLTKFSRLIRLILENSNQNTVSLQSELELIKLYVGLEQIRFDEQFTFELNLGQDLDTGTILIPPMIIQPFLENAILHGIHPKKKHSTLKLNIVRKGEQLLHCIIEDDGIGRRKAQQIKSEKATMQKSFGMSITEKRLQMISIDYQDLLVIKDAFPRQEYVGTRVELNIPIDGEKK